MTQHNTFKKENISVARGSGAKESCTGAAAAPASECCNNASVQSFCAQDARQQLYELLGSQSAPPQVMHTHAWQGATCMHPCASMCACSNGAAHPPLLVPTKVQATSPLFSSCGMYNRLKQHLHAAIAAMRAPTHQHPVNSAPVQTSICVCIHITKPPAASVVCSCAFTFAPPRDVHACTWLLSATLSTFKAP